MTDNYFKCFLRAGDKVKISSLLPQFYGVHNKVGKVVTINRTQCWGFVSVEGEHRPFIVLAKDIEAVDIREEMLDDTILG